MRPSRPRLLFWFAAGVLATLLLHGCPSEESEEPPPDPAVVTV